MSASAYVLVREDTDRPVYYIRTGLGIFWECSNNQNEAKRFATRAAASKALVAAGKNRQGWRVIPVGAR
jgi:hypothetical protein